MNEAEGILLAPQLPGRLRQLENDVTKLKEEQFKQDGLLEAVAEGVFELHENVETLNSKVDNIKVTFERRFEALEARVTRIEETMVTKFEFTQLLNWLDVKFAAIDQQFIEMKKETAAQFAEIKSILNQMNPS